MLREALRNKFDIVMAEALDRFSRDQEDTAGLFKRLTFAGVNIVTFTASGRRDELLRRAFTVSEQMFESSDRDVRDLVAIGLFEGRDPAWLKRAKPFVGRRADAWLTAYHDCWRDCSAANDRIVPKILDGYHVRTVIARELQLPEGQVPGETYATGRLPDRPLRPRGGG
jgi:Resolvase, N terminal domain